MLHIASVSFGADSSAMLLMLLKKEYPLDEVVFYNNGMEFQAVYTMRNYFVALLEKRGIRYKELTPEVSFEYNMFERPVNGKDGVHFGYSWCGGKCRWETRNKIRAIEKYICNSDINMYVGIAADELDRKEKEYRHYKSFPLIEWGMDENDCLLYCYENGLDWLEEGQDENGEPCEIHLYEILDRVSCWCCANKNKRELRNMFKYLPQYWEKLKVLQSKTSRPMKKYVNGGFINDIELEFIQEHQFTQSELEVTSRND